MKVHEFERLVNKLQLKVRDSRDRIAWFEYEGRIITRTKRSHGKGFDLPADLIRNQLKVSGKEMAGLIQCRLSLDDYVEILRRKKLL
jgi:hypothetical protein